MPKQVFFIQYYIHHQSNLPFIIQEIRIMGEQYSKTTSEKSTVDSTSNSSQHCISEKFQFEPISCSPEKLKKISRSKKINTTCVLKSALKIQNLDSSPQKQTQNKLEDVVLSQIDCDLLQKIETTFQITEDTDLVYLNCQDQNPNSDLHRIDSFFIQYQQSSRDFEFQRQQSSKEAEINRWKNSVNKIMKDINQIHEYRQGQLLICSIIRLYFSEQITHQFFKKLIEKIGYLFCDAEKYNTFSVSLSEKLSAEFLLLNKKLEQNDLDFQFLYTSWILGLFSSTLPQLLCIKIWYNICISQDSQKLVEKIIFKIIGSIQKKLDSSTIGKDITNSNIQQLQLTNQNILKMLDIQSIAQFVSKQE